MLIVLPARTSCRIDLAEHKNRHTFRVVDEPCSGHEALTSPHDHARLSALLSRGWVGSN